MARAPNAVTCFPLPFDLAAAPLDDGEAGAFGCGQKLGRNIDLVIQRHIRHQEPDDGIGFGRNCQFHVFGISDGLERDQVVGIVLQNGQPVDDKFLFYWESGDALLNRIKRLEREQNYLPRAIVQFADGHRERLDIHQIAVAFFERNKAEIVSLEWERASDDAIIFQLLSCPETWEKLTIERTVENEQN